MSTDAAGRPSCIGSETSSSGLLNEESCHSDELRLSVELLRRKLHQQAHLVALLRYSTYFGLFVLCALAYQAPTTSHGTLLVVAEAEAAAGAQWEHVATTEAANKWTQQSLPQLLTSLHGLCPACRISLVAARHLELSAVGLATSAGLHDICGSPASDPFLQSCANASLVAAALAPLGLPAPARPLPRAADGAVARVAVERAQHDLVLEYRAAEKARQLLLHSHTPTAAASLPAPGASHRADSRRPPRWRARTSCAAPPTSSRGQRGATPPPSPRSSSRSCCSCSDACSPTSWARRAPRTPRATLAATCRTRGTTSTSCCCCCRRSASPSPKGHTSSPPSPSSSSRSAHPLPPPCPGTPACTLL